MKTNKASIFLFFIFINNVLFAQNNVKVKPFESKLITEDYITVFDRSNGIDLKVEIKYSPNLCPTKTTFFVNYNGYFSTQNKYLIIKLKYINCDDNLPYILTFSVPLGKVDLDYSKWLGSKFKNYQANQEMANKAIILEGNDFTMNTNPANAVELIDLKVENYESSDTKKFDALEAPISIQVLNSNGELNCDQERANLGTQIVLKPIGGYLPLNGRWEWFKGDCSSSPIHSGSELKVLINDTFDFNSKYSLVGVDSKGNRSKCVNAYIFSNITEILLNYADNEFKNSRYSKASEMYNMLLVKYSKGIQVSEVTKKRNQAEELSTKDKIHLYRNTCNNSFNQISLDAKNRLKDDLGKGDRGKVKGQINFTCDSRGNKEFFIVSDLKSNMNDLLAYLNKNNNSYKSSVICLHSSKKEIMVTSKDSFLFDVNWETESKIIKLEKNNLNANSNPTITLILSQNIAQPYGVYKVTEKAIDYNGVKSVFTSIKGIKSYSGSGQVFKSMLLPGWGSRKVAENKYTKHISKFFVSSAALCIGSLLYSQKKYQDYLNAQDQSSMSKAYQKANLAHKVYYCTGFIIGAIYTIDIGYTLIKGFKNTKAIKNFTYVK
jgi:hypothetical protein